MGQQVREATEQDYEGVCDIALEFYERLHGKVADVEAIRRTIEHCMSSGVVVVSKNVTACGIAVFEWDAFAGKTVARELMWFATDGSGSAVLDMMQDLCRERGADEFYMTVVCSARPAAHAIVQRKGFKPAEITYKKEL